MSKIWTEELTAKLVSIVGQDTDTEISQEVISQTAESLDVGVKNVATKLRHMGYPTEKVATASVWPDEDTSKLHDYLTNNSGVSTAAETATQLFGEKYSQAQVRGKALSMNLASNFKKVEPKVAESKYTEDETNLIISMTQDGKSIEDISAAIDKEVNSIRGKCLSLVQKNLIEKIPYTSQLKQTTVQSAIDTVEDVTVMTVADIAVAIERTEKGVKAILTNRGLDCVDWKGSERKAKILAKKERVLAEAA